MGCCDGPSEAQRWALAGRGLNLGTIRHARGQGGATAPLAPSHPEESRLDENSDRFG